MLPDDYSPTNESAPRRAAARRAASPRLWPYLVVILALGAFGAVLGFTYFGGRGSTGDGTPPLVKADTRPVRVRPDSPGGMEVPHQDLEIYNRGGQAADGGRVERIVPPPETPPAPRPATAPPVLQPTIPAAPVVRPPDGAVPVTRPTVVPPAAAPPPAPPQAARSAPPAPRAASTPPQTAAAPRAPERVQLRPPASAGESRIQLRPPGGSAATARLEIGSFPTLAAANREWARLRRAHADLLGSQSAAMVRAQLAGQGTVYRIQIGPMANAAAAADLCSRLARRNVGCIVVQF